MTILLNIKVMRMNKEIQDEDVALIKHSLLRNNQKIISTGLKFSHLMTINLQISMCSKATMKSPTLITPEGQRSNLK